MTNEEGSLQVGMGYGKDSFLGQLYEPFKPQKSQLLLDQKELSNYLALNAPVDFDPDFQYRDTLDEWLRASVKDYDTVPIRVNGSRVYK